MVTTCNPQSRQALHRKVPDGSHCKESTVVGAGRLDRGGKHRAERHGGFGQLVGEAALPFKLHNCGRSESLLGLQINKVRYPLDAIVWAL
jgi:hypothetical protein